MKHIVFGVCNRCLSFIIVFPNLPDVSLSLLLLQSAAPKNRAQFICLHACICIGQARIAAHKSHKGVIITSRFTAHHFAAAEEGTAPFSRSKSAIFLVLMAVVNYARTMA
jgi:hypothetical protein